MTLLFTALYLHSAMLASPAELQLKGEVQLRSGYSHSPFAASPDAAPLLNAPVNQASSYTAYVIASPGAELRLRGRGVRFQLTYSPRLFISLQEVTSTAPTVFHAANFLLTLGQPHDWLVTIGGSVSAGGIDYGQGGQVLREFVGAVRAGTGTPPLSTFTLGAFVGAERSLGRAWKFSTLESVNKFGSPTTSTQAAQPLPTTDPNVVAAAPISLQSMQRAETRNTLTYRIDSEQSVMVGADASFVEFPGINTYLGVTPSLGWQGGIGKLTDLTLKIGVMKYWINPAANHYAQVRYMSVFEASVQRSFADVGLPRLSGRLSVAEGPYYDIIFGQLFPRGTATASATYAFSQKLEGRVELRDYTEAYFDGSRFVPIQKGRDKNVAILTTQLKYKYSPWLSYTGGIFGINRWIEPSAAVPYTSLQEVYLFLGVTGTYDVE